MTHYIPFLNFIYITLNYKMCLMGLKDSNI